MGYKVTRVTKGGEATANGATRFQTFEDLEVYKAAREFRKAIYAANRRLPGFEKFELASQMRRAAVSLTNNMAEGHGRFHYPDQTKFFLQARGSLQELVDDLNICFNENYLPLGEVTVLRQQAARVLLLTNGYLRHLRSRSPSVRETDAAEDDVNDLLDASPL
jgi:four helix bundle protein